jgi:actin-related protein 3
VIGSQIKHIPIAGRDITGFVMNLLRDRDEPIPPAQCLEMAKKIKV